VTLPTSAYLDTRRLGQVYQNTVATYKFYWFVALLDIFVKEQKTHISFWEIIIGMVAEAWYPIHYFRLSFGKSDSLYEQIIALQQELDIPIDADKNDIKKTLTSKLDTPQVKNRLKVFTLNVPYRFLSPWITYTNDNDVISQSQKFDNACLYALREETIEINPAWERYLLENYGILRDFSFWNLTLFLQKRNPNVPDIPSKLVKSIQRDSLAKQHKFWDMVIDIAGPIKCIYTDKLLQKKDYDLDHFIPWSFVSHNLLWNLLPADSSINSSKSNNLPPLEVYLAPLAKTQQQALRIMYDKHPTNTILEDYLIIHDSNADLTRLSEQDFLSVYRKTFAPMVQIAENMGYTYWHNRRSA
jgi:hypothetical protein